VSIRYLKYFFTITYKDRDYYLTTYGTGENTPEDGYFSYLCTNENDIFEIPCWMNSAVFYQIFPERYYNGEKSNDPKVVEKWNESPTRENYFGGDIRGIISKLDYISDMQVNAIYLNPIFLGSSNHKYDTIDYFKVDPMFGDIDDLKELVEKCHIKDIKVILDGVFNHCGYYCPMFQDVINKGTKSIYKDWFYIKDFPIDTANVNYECVGDYKWMPKLRYSTCAVREYFLSVGEFWLKEVGIDGWRLDVCDEVDYTFWQEFRKKIKSRNKEAVLIGEIWGEARDYLLGDQMDSVMNYLFRDAIVDFIAKGKITAREFDYRIQRMYAIYPEIVNQGLFNLIGSHDTERFLTLCKGNVLKLKIATLMQITFLGIPAIYYGDEVGMKGFNDPDCRRTMIWENQNKDLLEFYKKYLIIRKSRLSLIHGDFNSIIAKDDVYGFFRNYMDEITYVIINNSDREVNVRVPLIDNINIDKGLESLKDGRYFIPKIIDNEKNYYNSDIRNYKFYIDMIIPAFQFDILKIKEEF
jgi:glycosidase